MKDFLDLLLPLVSAMAFLPTEAFDPPLLLRVCIGTCIGIIALAILVDKNYQKFCPQ